MNFLPKEKKNECLNNTGGFGPPQIPTFEIIFPPIICGGFFQISKKKWRLKFAAFLKPPQISPFEKIFPPIFCGGLIPPLIPLFKFFSCLFFAVV
jgi:hypothetical protein